MGAEAEPKREYVGLFSGQRIGGLPTVQLKIIENELEMLEKSSHGLGRAGLATQVVKRSKRGNSAFQRRSSLARPKSRSGLDVSSNRERCIGAHDLSGRTPWDTSYGLSFGSTTKGGIFTEAQTPLRLNTAERRRCQSAMYSREKTPHSLGTSHRDRIKSALVSGTGRSQSLLSTSKADFLDWGHNRRSGGPPLGSSIGHGCPGT